VKPGELFGTFHTPALFLNHVTSPHRDGYVGAPEYKVTAVNIGSVRSRRRTASPERGCAAPPGERRRRIRRGRTESEGADHPGAAKGVGCLGDGINDASALHAADVGISVNNAVDVAREAAAIVLLEKDLHVLLGGVREGRTTFANTLKYVLMTTSANFGNRFCCLC
jgi:hypothetical protein